MRYRAVMLVPTDDYYLRVQVPVETAPGENETQRAMLNRVHPILRAMAMRELGVDEVPVETLGWVEAIE